MIYTSKLYQYHSQELKYRIFYIFLTIMFIFFISFINMEFIFYKISISELQNSFSTPTNSLQSKFLFFIQNFSFTQNFNIQSNQSNLPLLNSFTQQQDFIFTEIFEGFFSYLFFASYISILLTLPFFYYNIYKFLLPGISYTEVLLFKVFFYFSLFLFFIAHILTYTIVLPYAMSFLLDFQSNTDNLSNLHNQNFTSSALKISFLGRILPWIKFLIQLFTTVSFLFHLPLILFLCFLLFTKITINKPFQLSPFTVKITNSNNIPFLRKILFFFLVLLTAIFSPPDIYSQIFLLLPLFIIIEIFIFLVYIYLEYKNLTLIKNKFT